MSVEPKSTTSWRAVAVFFATLSLGLAFLLWWPEAEPEVDLVDEEPPPPELRLVASEFAELPGWDVAELVGFQAAFVRSCRSLMAIDGSRALHDTGLGGVAGDWRGACEAVRDAADPAALRAAIVAELRPWAMSDGRQSEGLLTGYYEASLTGSRTRKEGFETPLYERPADLVDVDLGKFRPALRGQRVAGRLSGRRLEPYEDRRDFDQGAVDGEGLELVWVDDPVDAFFLHIQGSGRVLLDNGDQMRVGYAGQNGHPYVPIGRILVERGEMVIEEVSMQSIRDWLDAHPDQAAELMQTNPSFVFFRELEGDGPLGSQGVALTGGASLAVDRSFLPMGLPVWLDGHAPAVDPADQDLRLRRLMVAQDTGGAIRGPLRGDVFWGYGDQAREIAGRMKHPTLLWMLLPRGIEPPVVLLSDVSVDP